MVKKTVVLLVTLVLLATFLIGCATPTATPTPTASPTPSTPTPSPTPTAAKLTMAAILYGHANEGTWDPAGYKGILAVQGKVPFELSMSEAVSSQDAEKVIRDWAARGTNIVFAHSDTYTDQLITVAANFPNVYFIGEFGIDPAVKASEPDQAKYLKENSPKNLVFLGDTPEEGNYLAGYAAALSSKAGKIGVLQPFESGTMNRYTNAFIYGAKAAKADIQITVVYVGDYLAPAETRDGIKSMAQQGVDVIFTELDDNSSILECAAQKIQCIAMYVDKMELDPATVLTSVVQDWAVQLQGPVEAVKNGTWTAFRQANYFQPQNLANGSVHLGAWGTAATAAVKTAVAAVEAKIISGETKVPMDDSKPLSGPKLSVTAILYGHANEGTWDTTIMDGFANAQKVVAFDLNLNEGTTNQDANKAMTDWSGKNVNVIMCHSNSYTDSAIEVAARFPNVYFIGEAYIDPDTIVGDAQQDKYKKAATPKNLVLAGVTPEEGNYLAGYVAGLMSKTGMVGVLQPFEAAPLNRHSNSFIFGAQAANPNIKFKIVYMGDYVAPDLTRDAVKSLKEQGADIIFSEMDDNSSILECAANGIYCITPWADKHDFDPKTNLVSVVSDFSVALTGALEAIQKGTWDAYRESNYFTPQTLTNKGTFLGAWGDAVPEDVKTKVAAIEAQFKDGSLKVEWSTDKLAQ